MTTYYDGNHQIQKSENDKTEYITAVYSIDKPSQSHLTRPVQRTSGCCGGRSKSSVGYRNEHYYLTK
jgi:hypothetical protein